MSKQRIITLVLGMMLVLTITAGCKTEKTEKIKIPPIKDVLEQSLKESLGKYFASRNMQNVTFDVEVIPEEAELILAQFVKLTFSDGANTQEQYVFTDGTYIIPDMTEVATGAGLKDRLSFKHSKPADIDLSKLSLAYGSRNAKNYIVEVTDFQCPYCRKAHEYLKDKLVGKNVAVYLVHYPLSFHPKAELYARIFEAGAAQDISFYDDLYATTPEFDAKTDEEIIAHFAAKTSDPAAFKLAVNDPALSVKISEQMKMAQSMGIAGTPALYFNGKLVSGYNTPMIDTALSSFE
jgi:thiol:disulfide interchange protein DsbC